MEKNWVKGLHSFLNLHINLQLSQPKKFIKKKKKVMHFSSGVNEYSGEIRYTYTTVPQALDRLTASLASRKVTIRPH